MKVAIISGSPRRSKNSETMAEEARDFFEDHGFETSVINSSETIILPCVHCDSCKKHPQCSKDEKANGVNKILEESDAILFISPVYFGSMTAQLKALIDKTLPLRRNKMALKGKIGAAIAVGGSRNGGQELTLQQIHGALLVHGMIIVGDNNHFGGTVHNPMEEDTSGMTTFEGTLIAVKNILKRLKN